MRHLWIESIDEFRNIAKEWDEAVCFSGEDNPFLLSSFILTWWKFYSADLQLRVFVVYDDNNIIGGLPLYRDKKAYLRYPGGSAAAYTELLSIKSKGHLIWKVFLKALGERKDWRCLYLKRYKKSQFDMRQSQLIMNYTGADIFVDVYKSGYAYLIDVPESFSDYVNYLPKKLRYYIRRAQEKFSKLGAINLFSLNSEYELENWCDKYIQLSCDSFRERNRESNFENNKYCLFFKELVREFFRARHLDAYALKLNNRIIAIHFGYSIRNNFNYLFPAFDVNFAELNPGHLLIYKLIELASKRKSKIFDLYTGYRFYKQQWCNRKEEILSIEIRPKSTYSSIERLVRLNIINSPVLNKLKKRIQSLPRTQKMVRGIKGLLNRDI